MTRLTNPLEVRRYLAHPEIFDAISADAQRFEDFIPPVPDDFHWIVTGEEAMFLLHPFPSKSVWQIHAHVHPDHRKSARQAALAALDYAFTELSALKVVAIIPEIFPRVRGFALKCGLSDQGYLSDSYIKHEQLYGQFLLGISRAEFEGI